MAGKRNKQANFRKKLIDFAHKHPIVDAISFGREPEENHPVYYFLTSEPDSNEGLTRAIAGLDVQLSKELGYHFELMRWPVSPDQAHEYPFLGELIWRKNQ